MNERNSRTELDEPVELTGTESLNEQTESKVVLAENAPTSKTPCQKAYVDSQHTPSHYPKAYVVVRIHNGQKELIEVYDTQKDAEQCCAIMNDRHGRVRYVDECHVEVVNKSETMIDDSRPTVRKMTVKVTMKKNRTSQNGADDEQQNRSDGNVRISDRFRFELKQLEGYDDGLIYFAGRKPKIEKNGRVWTVQIYTDRTWRHEIYDEVMKVIEDELKKEDEGDGKKE